MYTVGCLLSPCVVTIVLYNPSRHPATPTSCASALGWLLLDDGEGKQWLSVSQSRPQGEDEVLYSALRIPFVLDTVLDSCNREESRD
uniref:Secreted protein n=1 Tax=Panagrellus redivivus TaxID=6233 RepID=A0A7E4V8V2_PANRE